MDGWTQGLAMSKIDAQSQSGLARVSQRQSRNIIHLLSKIRVILRFLFRDKLALFGVVIYIFFGAIAILAPYIAPHGPIESLKNEQGVWLTYQNPSAKHPLGTTNLAYDVFSQLIYGSQTALLVGLVAAVAVMLIGTIIGLISGYFGGWVDEIFMRLTDLMFSIPFIPFIMIMVAYFGQSVWYVLLAIVILLWTNTARVIRAQVLSLKQRPFVESAKITGASNFRIIFVHIAPNILPLMFLYGSLAIGWAILTESSMSFLGFGDPNLMTWGRMLQSAYANQAMSLGAWWWFLPPGLCIMLTVIASFAIGKGYESVLFPKLNTK